MRKKSHESDSDMKTYRVTRVEPMLSPSAIVKHKVLYEIVFRASPDDVSLEFDNLDVIKGFQGRCLDAFEHIPSEWKVGANFAKEFAATSFGNFVEALGQRDKGLLRRAIWKLSEPGRNALLKAGN